MSVLSRLARLEADVVEGDLGLAVADIEDEARRWDAALEPAVLGVGREPCLLLRDAAEQQFMSLWRLLEESESDHQSYAPEGMLQRVTVYRRWPRAAAAFVTATPGDLRDRVLEDGLVRRNDRGPWLVNWLHDLCEIRCRVPPGVAQAVFAMTVLPSLEVLPAGDYHDFPAVCEGCGLRHFSMSWVRGKYQCRDTPKTCPHCGHEGHLWPCGRLGEKSFEWLSQAERELAFN
jgi:hypothetical protein